MAELNRTVRTIPATRTRFSSPTLARQHKRRVAAYARVSTDSDEQFTSYEAQIDYYTNYIKFRDDWEFVDVYTDEGIAQFKTVHECPSRDPHAQFIHYRVREDHMTVVCVAANAEGHAVHGDLYGVGIDMLLFPFQSVSRKKHGKYRHEYVPKYPPQVRKTARPISQSQALDPSRIQNQIVLKLKLQIYYTCVLPAKSHPFQTRSACRRIYPGPVNPILHI